MGDDAKRSVRHATAEAFRRLQKGAAGNSAPRSRTESKPLLAMLVAGAAIGVGLLVVLGVIVGVVKVLEYGVGPLLSYVGVRLIPLLFTPGALPTLVIAVLVMGLLLAPRFRDPWLFLMGLTGPILAIVALWQLPRAIGVVRERGAGVELEGPVLIVGLIVCVFLFIGGIQLMSTAKWIGKQKGVSGEDDE
jgi:hypothetical protein